MSLNSDLKKILFSEYLLGRIKLKNRVVMAPMTRSRAPGNVPNEMMSRYYALRAEAGLLISEGVSPSPNGLGYARIPGCFNEEQALGWKKVAEAVHARGGRIFMQLMHTGRVSHSMNLAVGARVLAPSAISLKGKIWTDQKQMQDYPQPEVMSMGDIQQAIQEYARSASLALDAGFDGVELHGANGYLIDQFLNPAANQRTDDFGGTPENRMRFALEVARATVQAIGADRVGFRVSPYGVFNDQAIYDEIEEFFGALAKQLSDLGLVYLHIVDHSAQGAPEVKSTVKVLLRKEFHQTLILSGGYDADRAEKDLQDKKGDLIAFGRGFISNPNLVEKFRTGVPWVPADPSTFYSAGEKGYLDYPV